MAVMVASARRPLMALSVVIAGAGGAGLKVVQILEDRAAQGDSDLKCIGFVDDNSDLWETSFFGYPILGGPDVLSKVKGEERLGVICPIGDPVNRRCMIDRLRVHNVEYPCAVHPSAQISSRAQIGCGNVFSQNVVIQAGVLVGNFTTFNISAIMGPLSAVYDFCTVNAGVMIASETIVHDYCYIGMGAKIVQRITLAEGTVVGANAFVNKTSEPWTTVVGLPAVQVKQKQNPFLCGR